MSLFISSSGLSPGSREAKVQRAKVCLNCMEPSVARSSCWLLPVGRYLSDVMHVTKQSVTYLIVINTMQFMRNRRQHWSWS